MSMFTVLLVLPIPLFLFVIALLVVLQVRLCKKSTKLGLILPAVSFVFSLLMTFFVVFNMVGAGPANIVVIAITFLAVNIPTIIFGSIWLHYKSRKDTLNDLKRMQIEDLE